MAPNPEEKQGPWVRYRVEHRSRLDDHIIAAHETRDFETGVSQYQGADKQPIFEVVTSYRVSARENADGEGPLLPSSLPPPSYHMKIFSPAIINAIQSVVHYYPSQDLTGDVVRVQWPYAVLVHHYDELTRFRDECAREEKDKLCIRAHDAPAHLEILLKYLDETIMPGVRAEMDRNANGMYTFEHAWVLLKPGATWLASIKTQDSKQGGVIQKVTGGSFENPPTTWNIHYWCMAYDGQYFGRSLRTIIFDKFDGEIKSGSRIIREEDLDKENLAEIDPGAAKYLEYGKKYIDLLQRQCKRHSGKSGEFPYNDVEGLVMSDLKAYFAEPGILKLPLMSDNDLRNWTTDCRCNACNEKKASSTAKAKNMLSLFDEYNYVDFKLEKITNHMYFLCPPYIKAFVFATRKWETLHVKNFQEPDFSENMINSLVMNEERKKTLKALAKSFARRNKRDEAVARDMWTADFVKGKGRGLIFLLHGRPGVGKTCTAECIAEFARRPLMVLTPSDIGTTIEEVEKNLTKHFKTATSWGAILLIDEADIFMEQRTTADLERNGLVAGFLRALENYNGILFLTTNRVGSFDDAFISRVHIQLYYPDFTDEQRQLVWKTFIDKLARERGDSMRLNIDAKEYIRGKDMLAVKWNGREIRNAFQTAVALAEYDGETDEEGKVLVTDSHFRAVVELSQDFKSYLEELHRGDEGKRAARKFERLDTFSTDAKPN